MEARTYQSLMSEFMWPQPWSNRKSQRKISFCKGNTTFLVLSRLSVCPSLTQGVFSSFIGISPYLCSSLCESSSTCLDLLMELKEKVFFHDPHNQYLHFNGIVLCTWSKKTCEETPLLGEIFSASLPPTASTMTRISIALSVVQYSQ